MNPKLQGLKAILIGIVFTLLAGMPFLSGVLPEQVHYNETTKPVSLAPGQNRIDKVLITIDKAGKVLQAQKIDRQISNRILGFRNLRIFLLGGAPFLSSLAFCLFFFWYDRQPKTRQVLTLKKSVWCVFFFVSLWFTCWAFIIHCDAIPKAFRYAGIYIAAIGSSTAAYYLYRYCSSHKHNKIALLLRYIFELRDLHYPRMAHKAMEKREAYEKTRQQIREYEQQTAKVLAQVVERPASMPVAATPSKAKLIPIGLFLAALALMPLLHQFVPRQVNYIETAQAVPLQPGLNTLDNIALSLSPAAKLLHAEKTERQITDKIFGFQNVRGLFLNAAPFFSLLSFCFFFFWYERQQKNRYVVILKNYTFGVFFLVSLWFTGWTFIPEVDPISQGFYQSGIYLAVGMVAIAFCYLYWHYTHKLRQVWAKAAVLLFYVFEVKKRHYPRMALKAIKSRKAFIETCQQIREYDRCTTWVVDKVKGFIRGEKLKKAYREYKRFTIDP